MNKEYIMDGKRLIIDRIENGIAVCETSDGMSEIPVSQLPLGVREGSVLYFHNGVYSVDFGKTQSRKLTIAELQKKAFGKK